MWVPWRVAVQATWIKVLSLVMEPPLDFGFQPVLQGKSFFLPLLLHPSPWPP